MSKLTEAVSAHKAAWQAYQDAPDESVDFKAAERASIHEVEAMEELLRIAPKTPDDLAALEMHLRWFDSEERDLRAGMPTYDIAFAMLGVIDLAKAGTGASIEDRALNCARRLRAEGRVHTANLAEALAASVKATPAPS